MFHKLDIVERITSLLSEKKIPATKFAEDMGGKKRGYGKSTVYSWKKNQSTSYMDDLQLIADYLNVSTDFLLTGKEYISNEMEEMSMLNLNDAMLKGYKYELKIFNDLGGGAVDIHKATNIDLELLYNMMGTNSDVKFTNKQFKAVLDFIQRFNYSRGGVSRYKQVFDDYFYSNSETETVALFKLAAYGKGITAPGATPEETKRREDALTEYIDEQNNNK